MDLGSPAMVLIGGLIVFTASVLSGVVGFAYGLFALPLLLLVGLPLHDAVMLNLILGLSTRFVVARRFSADIDWVRTGCLVIGGLPGIALGILVQPFVRAAYVELTVGVIALSAIALLLAREGRRIRPRRRFFGGAGFTGGLLGATTSLSGIPPALLLAWMRIPARTAVSELAIYFIATGIITIPALVFVAGVHLSTPVVELASLWTPIALVGNAVGVALMENAPELFFRRLTLVAVGISGGYSAVAGAWHIVS